jgi:molybdopterin converting factor small subunit
MRPRSLNWYTVDMRVELLGVPRERAGVAELELQADTLGQLLTALVDRFPELDELITAEGFEPSVVANLNGDRFVRDPHTRLEESDSVLILCADAGG